MGDNRIKVCNWAGLFVYFDTELYPFIEQETGWTVCSDTKGYKFIRCTKPLYRGKVLARVLMNCTGKLQVDHRNGNSLDNRLENLRVVTSTQNNTNKDVSTKKKSGLPKGVTFDSRYHIYTVTIKVNGIIIYLGSFTSIERAELEYLRAAEKYFGEFAAHTSRK